MLLWLKVCSSKAKPKPNPKPWRLEPSSLSVVNLLDCPVKLIGDDDEVLSCIPAVTAPSLLHITERTTDTTFKALVMTDTCRGVKFPLTHHDGYKLVNFEAVKAELPADGNFDIIVHYTVAQYMIDHRNEFLGFCDYVLGVDSYYFTDGMYATKNLVIYGFLKF